MNQKLDTNEILTSGNSKFFAVMQGDGNFVIYKDEIKGGNHIWQT